MNIAESAIAYLLLIVIAVFNANLNYDNKEISKFINNNPVEDINLVEITKGIYSADEFVGTLNFNYNIKDSILLYDPTDKTLYVGYDDSAMPSTKLEPITSCVINNTEVDISPVGTDNVQVHSTLRSKNDFWYNNSKFENSPILIDYFKWKK